MNTWVELNIPATKAASCSFNHLVFLVKDDSPDFLYCVTLLLYTLEAPTTRFEELVPVKSITERLKESVLLETLSVASWSAVK